MATFYNDDNTKAKAKASLSNLQASRIPMMQRMNQQFLIESKFQDYNDDIINLGSKSRQLLDSIEEQEAKLKAMREALHLHPSTADVRSIPSPREKCRPKVVRQKGILEQAAS